MSDTPTTVVDKIEPCGAKKCRSAFNGNPGVATVDVLWPGQPVRMCSACAAVALGVAAAMGMPLEVRPLGDSTRLIFGFGGT